MAIHWDAAEREAEQSTQAPGAPGVDRGPDVGVSHVPGTEALSHRRVVSRTPTRSHRRAKLADMRDRGVLTQAEFDVQKAKLLAEI